MKRYSLTFIFATVLMLIVSTPSANAQKVVLHMTGNKTFECNISELDSISFVDAKEHEWVDLGLPSGTLWATCNVGANSPEEYGDYFAWGETKPKEEYSWETYNIAGLDVIYDTATENWGNEWQTPSKEQFEELKKNCTVMWTTRNSVNGEQITSKSNGKSIFLPAAGCVGEFPLLAGSFGEYWSCTPLCRQHQLFIRI